MVDARQLSPRWSTPAAEDPQRPVAGNDRATAPAGGGTSWRVSAAVALGATFFALAAAAFAGELVLRHRERQRTNVAGIMPLLFYRHSRLGHALVRDYDYFGHIHVDREGFRGPDVPVSKVPGTLRIMAVGSSTTFDPGVSSDTATWPARLQAWLQRLAPDQRVEVINAGVPGYRVIDDLIRLEMDLSRYRPDVVILYEGHNDLFGALRRTRVEPPAFISTPDEIPSVTPWGHWLTRHSLLYGKLVGRLEVLHFVASGRRASATGAPQLPPQAVVDTGARRFEQDLTAFLAVTRSFDIRVVIPELVQMSGVGSLEEPDSTIRRIWSYTVPFARPETVLQGYVRYNEALRNTARRFGATWIPTDSFGLAGKEWYEEGDPIHFNDRGAERMAQQLARALITRHALDVPPASAR